MVENSKSLETSWLMIPFWTDPENPNYSAQVEKFRKFASASRQLSGLKLAVIDDGAGITAKDFEEAPDLLVSLPENKGKAQAIREGLACLLNQPKRPEYIVQYDGDGDQIPQDIPRVYSSLLDESHQNPLKPTLVIGNRYSEGLKTPPNPESVAYRQTLLIFFGAIANQLTGAENVRDWVSGARGYTSGYAEEFIKESRADRYGVESEQLIVAGLTGAHVATARLTDSRPRDPWTLTSKWLQNFEVYSRHDSELREKGFGHVLDLVGDLVSGLKSGEGEFTLDLSKIGVDTNIRLWRWDQERHSAEIPAKDRAKIFEIESDFPFTLVRSDEPIRL